MKKLLFLVPCFLFLSGAFAADSDLVLDIRRVGFDFSQTSVHNAADYSDSPIQALKANSQEYVKGVGDIALEYTRGRLNWTNKFFTEYGRTKLSPYNANPTVNENADKVLFNSDLAYAWIDTGAFKFGPTAGAAYETEYTANGTVPRQNIARSNAGFSLFDHAIVKELRLVGVYEYDFTYSDRKTNKGAAEFGWRIEYEIREGVKLSTNGYYREYLAYSNYVGTDLERDLSATARLDTNLWGSFTMGPYVQYRLAKSREAEVYGSNFIIGISFNYITKFDLN